MANKHVVPEREFAKLLVEIIGMLPDEQLRSAVLGGLLYASRTRPTVCNIMQELYAWIASGKPGETLWSVNALIYGLLQNPDLIPLVKKHVDQIMKAQHDRLCLDGWRYVCEFSDYRRMHEARLGESLEYRSQISLIAEGRA